ncbi:MAG: selenide, water dikinase SelD [Bdellovibrio sp.]|nr:MAG: selenide, water dikinase SelD [Bdellovibrio sp.]
MMSETVRLTQTVQKGGCAAKVAAHELRALLARVKFPPTDPAVRVDGSTFDDAAIVEINDRLALVQTLDFFTPIVDSPRLFGQIAAANALSDVYAMGGLPKTAMAILAYPVAKLDRQVISEVIQGACETLSQAKTSLVGGHSIDDETLKFGLSVTGFVDPRRVWTNAGAQPGDVLILTKPLGTGTLTAGLKKGAWSENEMAEAMDSMSQINALTDLLSDTPGIHAATDVTGFGLAGHGLQLAKESQCGLEFSFSHLPLFCKALTSLTAGHLTKAHRTNAEYVGEEISFNESLSPTQRLMMFDPQTSGGLLLTVDPDRAAAILSRIQKRFPRASAVGRVIPSPAARGSAAARLSVEP